MKHKKSGVKLLPSLAFCKIGKKFELYEKINEDIYDNLEDLLGDKSIDYDDVKRLEIKKIIRRFGEMKDRFCTVLAMANTVFEDIESCKKSVVCRMLHDRVVESNNSFK